MSNSSVPFRAPPLSIHIALLVLGAVFIGCSQNPPVGRTFPTAIPFVPAPSKTTSAANTIGRTGHIVFVTDRDGPAGIFVMNVDGSSAHRLTHSEGDDAWPTFSPDGTKILYESTVNGRTQIFVMSADGQHSTSLAASQASDEFPTWSPDGSRIAFASDRGGHVGIYVMNADGSGVTPLTDHPSNNWFPAWSPDGTVIAFISDRDGSNGNIFLMDPTGNHLKQITTETTLVAKPTWAPDSQHLAVFSHGGFFTVALDGSDLKPVTGDGEDPAWSPDGRWIAFASRRDTELLQIYITKPDGSSVQHLTHSNANDWAPAWGP